MDDDKKPPAPEANDVMMQQSYPSPTVDSADAQYYHQLAGHRNHDQVMDHQTAQPDTDGLSDLSRHQQEHQEDHNLHELQELHETSAVQHHPSRPSICAEELQLAAQLGQGLTQGLAPMIAAAAAPAAVAVSAVGQDHLPQEEQRPPSSLPPLLPGPAQEQEPEQDQHIPHAEPEIHRHPDMPSPPGIHLRPHHEMQAQPEMQPQAEMQPLSGMQPPPETQSPLEMHPQPNMQAHSNMQQQLGPNLQEQLEASFRSRGHGLPEPLPHTEQPRHHFAQAQQEMTTPHTHTHTPPHLPPHLALDHLPYSQHQPTPDNTPPRKRSKVSRACDECRRKKIKCDSQSETGEHPCTNCQRSNGQCLFSRVPQKRGPSKGYIKELADRINNIEGKLNHGGSEGPEGVARRSSTEGFVGDETKKRPFSSIGVDGFPTPSPTQPAAYTLEQRQILPLPPPKERSATANGHVLRAIAPTNFPSEGQNGLLSQPDTVMSGMSQPDAHVDGLPEVSPQADEWFGMIEDAAFAQYLEVFHPIFPFLADNKSKVQSSMRQCPSVLREAFACAFFSMMKQFLQEGSQLNVAPQTAVDLLRQFDAQLPRARRWIVNLVRLQTLIMMIISADHDGPWYKGHLPGPPNEELIAQAVSLGHSMKLHLTDPDPSPPPETERDSDLNVAIRAWWVLVSLDRWNAIGTGIPSLISNDNLAVSAGLEYLGGAVALALSRLAYILGCLLPSATCPVVQQTGLHSASRVPPPASSMLAPLIEAVRWWLFMPTSSSSPILLLAYWHIRLLAGIVGSPPQPAEILLETCRSIVTLLAENHELRSPLTHHFIALVSATLLDLSGREDATRLEAQELARQVVQYAMAPSPWNAVVRERIEESLQMRTVGAGKVASDNNGNGTAKSEAVVSGNLHQLADVAAAVEGEGAPAAAHAQSHGTKGDAVADCALDVEGQVAQTLGAAMESVEPPAPLASGSQAVALPPHPLPASATHGQLPTPVEVPELPVQSLLPAVQVNVREVVREGYLTWLESSNSSPA